MQRPNRMDYLFQTPVLVLRVEDELCQKYARIIDNYVFPVGEYSDSTKDNLHTLEEFLELKTVIDQEMGRYSDMVGLEPGSLEMSCMWANEQKSGCSHPMHQHPNSYFSGVVYLDVPDDISTGNIVFRDPRPAKNMFMGNFVRQSSLSDKEWIYNVSTATMILFPSWLEHGTMMFQTDTGRPRICVAFNYMLTKCVVPTMSFNSK